MLHKQTWIVIVCGTLITVIFGATYILATLIHEKWAPLLAVSAIFLFLTVLWAGYKEYSTSYDE